MKQSIKKIINKLPYIRTLKRTHDTYKTLYPPGHFYSPIPSLEEVNQKAEQIFIQNHKGLNRIELNEKKQLALLNELKNAYKGILFDHGPKGGLRYYFNNNMFTYGDAVILFCLLRHFRSKNVIAIGSGFSSALMLDTNEYFLNNATAFTFIDPDTSRLLKLLTEKDLEGRNILNSAVQDVNVDLFKQLNAHDILFVDSSHVSKTGSDLNHILFNILPVLKSNVLIHFHDIFYPFEYPQDWVMEGRAWNECYLLRAFLQHNRMYEIVLFNSYLDYCHSHWMAEHLPLSQYKAEIPGHLVKECSSLWLRKK